MGEYRTGVHTVEIKTEKAIDLEAINQLYRPAITWEKGNRYRLTIPKLPNMGEYNGTADTQKAIERALYTISPAGTYGTVTRVDYRLDDHVNPYGKELPLMRAVVYLIAYALGTYDRLVTYRDHVGVITSVRCMPDKESPSGYGLEYYDKERQKGTRKYGLARLELRRLNLNGECVACVLEEWAKVLEEIDRETYAAMLEVHARAILKRREEETEREFIRSIKSEIITAEEEGIIMKKMGVRKRRYQCVDLPKWVDVQAALAEIIGYLRQNSDGSPNMGEIEPPF